MIAGSEQRARNSKRTGEKRTTRTVLVSVCLLPGVLLLSICLAEAQQTGKVPRIGYLAGAGSAPSQAFLQGLWDLGYVEGQNIALEYRTAEFNAERYPISQPS
jgi:putative ABC transport system substrate-binding protein